MNDDRVQAVLTAALECSVYVSPTDPGLTPEELYEAGRRMGLRRGEMEDSLGRLPIAPSLGGRLVPDGKRVGPWLVLSRRREPDYLNHSASEHLHVEMKAAVREHGAAAARMERGMLVERAVAKGLPRTDVEAAITVDILRGHFTEEDGMLKYVQGHEKWPLPSEQRRQGTAMSHPPLRSEVRAEAYAVVKDVIERRTDGRASSAEPLDAFAEQLARLGYAPFRLWWKQTVGELRRGDVQSTPVSVTVLSAALVEGVLTFVVRHARTLNAPTLASRDFEREPHTWRIEDLVRSAAHGGEGAILDQAARQRAETLIRTRQRIHAGRMLSDFPQGVPDLRPEEARDARAVADMVVRRVLDWLVTHPG